MGQYKPIKIGFNSPDSQQFSARAIIAIFPYKEKKIVLKNFGFLSENPPKSADSSLDLRSSEPIIITNDILMLSVDTAKNGLSHTLSTTLASGTYNYLSVAGPSDYIFAWIVNSDKDREDIVGSLRRGVEANGFNSGLKFFGQVQTIQKNFRIDASGTKTTRFSLNALGFQAYHSQVVYSPFLVPKDGLISNANSFVRNFFSSAGNVFEKMLENNYSAQDELIFFHKVLLGAGPGDQTKSESINYQRVVRNAFGIPVKVARTFGQKLSVDTEPTYADIIAFIIGIGKYSEGDSGLLGPDSIIEDENGDYGTYFLPYDLKNRRLRGRKLLSVSPSMNAVIINILQEYLNPAINEMYATLRPKPDGKSDIVPSFICRQMPFSKKKDLEFENTNFFDLPRFEINPSIITSYDISKSDAMRINTVLVTMQPVIALGASFLDAALNVRDGGWSYDPSDIVRNGQRVHQVIVTDDIYTNVDAKSSKGSAKEPHTILGGYNELIADFIENLHLKYSGSISMVGIQEPICVGENIQFGEILGHIESVNHSYQVASNGLTTFRTTVTFSHGVHLKENSTIMSEDMFKDDDSHEKFEGRSFDDISGGRIKETVSSTQQEFLKLKDKA